mgnify:CR=1 FL=1
MQTIRISKDLLVQNNLEATPARIRVLSICLGSETPLLVEEVASKVGSTAHLATIYRTLEKLVKVGILEKIDFHEGKFRYEYPRHHHHHAVCESCGKIEDVVDTQSEIGSIEARVAQESGFFVTRHIMELFGICNKCRQKGHS